MAGQPSGGARESEVDERLSRLLSASGDGFERELDAAAAALAEPPECWPDAGRAVLAVSARLLARLWRNGWQPADLARHAGRELAARPARMLVDLVAAEARAYPEAAVPPRWRAQLDALGAEVWWRDDTAWLPGLAAREKADRFTTATAVLELLHLLARLPRVQLISPPPGGAALAPPPPRGGPSRMLDRIRALLAKAESTEYPEEAEALTAKAQQLVALHSIDEALLAAAAPDPDAPEAVRIAVEAPYEEAKAVLLAAVAAANRARAVWSRELGYSTVVGFASDLEAVELLYTSLLVQANAALAAADREHAAKRGRTRSFRASFLVAYAARISERLAGASADAAREAEAAGPPGSLLPVLAAREDAVQRSTERLFPAVSTGRGLRVRDHEGWTAGRAAADRAGLGRRGDRGRGKLTRRQRDAP